MVFETRSQDLCFEGSWERPLDGINVCPTVVEKGTLVVGKGTLVVRRGTLLLWFGGCGRSTLSVNSVKEQSWLFVSRVSNAHRRATKEQRLSPPSGENSLTWKLWAGAAMPITLSSGFTLERTIRASGKARRLCFLL